MTHPSDWIALMATLAALGATIAAWVLYRRTRATKTRQRPATALGAHWRGVTRRRP